MGATSTAAETASATGRKLAPPPPPNSPPSPLTDGATGAAATSANATPATSAGNAARARATAAAGKGSVAAINRREPELVSHPRHRHRQANRIPARR